MEPASAAGVAGVLKLGRKKYFVKKTAEGKRPLVVCVLTGHGLKDPDCALKSVKRPKAVPARLDAILEAIKL